MINLYFQYFLVIIILYYLDGTIYLIVYYDYVFYYFQKRYCAKCMCNFNLLINLYFQYYLVIIILCYLDGTIYLIVYYDYAFIIFNKKSIIEKKGQKNRDYLFDQVIIKYTWHQDVLMCFFVIIHHYMNVIYL